MKLYLDNDNMLAFFKGLNDNYAVICSQIMLIKHLSLGRSVFLLMQQQERQFHNGIASSHIYQSG